MIFLPTENNHSHCDHIDDNNQLKTKSLLLIDCKEGEPPGIILKISNLSNVINVHVNCNSIESFESPKKGDKNIKRGGKRRKKDEETNSYIKILLKS